LTDADRQINFRPQLDQLEAAQLVRRLVQAAQTGHSDAAGVDVAYMFKHALTQEAAYQSLLRRRRNEIHLLVAHSYEELYPGRLDDYAALLESHYAEAGDDPKTLVYAQRAGKVAARVYAYTEAVAHYSLALEAAARLGRSIPELHRERGLVYETMGQPEMAQTDHETALEMARAAGDREDEWQALLDLGLLWAERDYTQVERYYRAAFELAQGIGEPSKLAHSLNRLGNWHLNVEQPQEARQYHAQALEIFKGLGDRGGIAGTLDLLGMASALSARLTEARSYLAQAVALFRELDDRRGLASALASLAMQATTYQTDIVPTVGTLAEAASYAREAAEVARGIGWRSGEVYALFVLGSCLGSAGDDGAALETLEAALNGAGDIRHRQWLTAAHCALGKFYLNLLSFPDARLHLDEGLLMARETGSGIWIHTATGYLGSLYVAEGKLDGAGELLDQAIDPGTHVLTLGQRLICCAQAELALARGDADQALELCERLSASTPVPPGGQAIMRVSALRGMALAALGRLDEAEVALHAARETAIAQGARPSEWRIRLTMAGLYRREGRTSEADGELSAAREIVKAEAETLRDERVRNDFLDRALAFISTTEGEEPRQEQ